MTGGAPPTYVVRAPRVGDARQIGELRNLVWRATYAGMVPENFLAALDDGRAADAWHTRLETTSARGVDLRSATLRVAVDVEAERVVGLAAAGSAQDPLDGAGAAALEVRFLNIHPDHVGHGLGSRILAVLTGARDCHMWVIERNTSAQLFLRRNGFVRTTESRAHPEVAVREVLMVRRDWTAPGL